MLAENTTFSATTGSACAMTLPAYNVAPVFYSQTLAKHPGLEGIFAQISPLLTDETMRTLNGKADVNGEEPADVAFDWMKDQGLVTEAE
jgi:osmoprotectant transport system substrate-binding protein